MKSYVKSISRTVSGASPQAGAGLGHILCRSMVLVGPDRCKSRTVARASPRRVQKAAGEVRRQAIHGQMVRQDHGSIIPEHPFKRSIGV